ncbi:DUF7673 family protein [Rhodoferax bucti]|uniref:DUF7673 family protein n=1 Tax=Rhodoferax bucti TaxID=2576305 RepID=UPI0011085544|nr:hypothetical protein [Rhodoferax bucti]
MKAEKPPKGMAAKRPESEHDMRAKERVIATENEIIDDLNDPFFKQMQEYQAAAEEARRGGFPALRELMKLAEESDTGQARAVARLLAGLYNSHAYPFPLNHLRGLDLKLHTQCLAVIALDSIAPEKEIHEYFENGSRRFQIMFKKFGIEPV